MIGHEQGQSLEKGNIIVSGKLDGYLIIKAIAVFMEFYDEQPFSSIR